MKSLNQIYSKLGLTQENGLFFLKDHTWRGMFSNRIERLLDSTIQPESVFCIDNKPFILFFENLSDKKSKLKEIWNFNECPVIIISNQDSIEIYNGFNYLTEEETLKLLGNEEQLTEFTYFELVTGKTWEKYQNEFAYNHRVDHFLLENIKSAREALINNGLSKELANSLLGKIIFVRYLIDRNVKLDFEQQGNSREWTNEEFCNLLTDNKKVAVFFQYLNEKFNGDLFPIEEADLCSISDGVYSVIIELLRGNQISTGQISLFNFYDFSIIPIEFISNVYELFIGQNQQEENGAYYTPLFLVDYILSETVEKKLLANNELEGCKVLDPSCGSGIFLVESLRKVIENYNRVCPNYADDSEKYKAQLKKLAIENIFGVDKDKNAINVAIFSIYLTLLDYQKPSDIETFKFPLMLGVNFFCSDFFDTNSEFNSAFREIDFDFILGNPPWKGNSLGDLGKTYVSQRRKIEKPLKLQNEITINNGELAEAFMLRVSDFSAKQTRIALIIRSQILYNPGYSKYFSLFRKYWLQEFFVDQVLELAPTRKEIFVNAVAPACVVFYRYAFSEPTNLNELTHISLKPNRFFSLFKVFTIQRNDYKIVKQENLFNNDWLWKVLVYGNYLDFNFIQRLKEDFHTIDDELNQGDHFIYGTGIQFSSNEIEDSEHLIGKSFIDTKGVESFFLNENVISIFEKNKVHRSRDSRLYQPPMLLIREGLNMSNFQAKCAVSERELLFKDSIAVIKAMSFDDIEILRGISAILQSVLFSYYSVATFSSIGIERERAKNYNKFSLPFFISESAVNAARRIEELNKKKYVEHDFSLDLDREIEENNALINSSILSFINANDEEKSLIDYAMNVSIPLIRQNNGFESVFASTSFKNTIVNEFAELFLDRLNPSFVKNSLRFVVDIQYTEQIIGMFFKLVPLIEMGSREPVNWIKSENSSILQFLSSLGVGQITDRLFVQKDIRGFEEDGFYLIKPNEGKLWHKAIAYLDMYEFVDAILVAGKNKTQYVQ